MGQLPVVLTRPLAELEIAFCRCKDCGTWRRALTFTAEECQLGHWRLGREKGIDTAKRSCPRCYSVAADRVEFTDPRHLWKLYMTPTTSHAVFEPEPPSQFMLSPTSSVVMHNFPAENRPKWLAEETRRRPVAQLLPKPSPLNDVFLHAWGPLFGGIAE